MVGIGSYNDAPTIEPLVRAVSEALASSGRAARIVVADGGSTDRTLELAQRAAGDRSPLGVVQYRRPAVDPLRAPYHGLAGRPAAIRAVLQDAVEGHAATCLFLDAKLTSVTPEWVARITGPVVAGTADYATPYYVRHPFEGALTRSVVYPVFRALYGVRLRQPASGEFSCSSRFITHALEQTFWDREEAQTGIDLWLASAAVVGRFRVCEVAAGVRTHATPAEAPDLTTTIVQVVGALFADLEARAEVWQRIRSSGPLPFVDGPPVPDPPEPPLDVEQMVDSFRLGYSALREVWAWVMPPRTILQLKRLAGMSAAQIRVPDEVWAEIVYDFALAYRARNLPRDHLLGSFTPLYLAWLAGFAGEVRSGAIDPEQRLERLCLTFEAKKPYLISGWRWPERFRA